MKKTLGQIFGCSSMLGANVVIEFGKKNGTIYIKNLDNLPTSVRNIFDWKEICKRIEQGR